LGLARSSFKLTARCLSCSLCRYRRDVLSVRGSYWGRGGVTDLQPVLSKNRQLYQINQKILSKSYVERRHMVFSEVTKVIKKTRVDGRGQNLAIGRNLPTGCHSMMTICRICF
jgi:hypothetical protein